MTPLDMEGVPQCFSSPDFVTTVHLMDVNTQDDSHKRDQVLVQNVCNGECSCKHATTASMIVGNYFLEGLERKADGVSPTKQGYPVAKPEKQSSSGWTCNQTVSGDKRLGNPAACWLDLLRLDIKGRLSALKRSRRRIQSMVISGWHQDKVSHQEDLLKTGMGCNVGAGSKGGSEVTGWRAFFLNMDAVLDSEGTKLVNCFRQIREMQFRCRKTSCWSSLLLNHEVGCMDAESEGDLCTTM
ncbi:hypothetical protein GOP47_0003785 [Adiantum capillus-veneris]|uniref:Uncharacterized protein n=1 Tax=Adiantum capillus-veneris TaxID=13818 RepID=A0A9D4ZNW3_ADICA|nr:hypothetical protein GOP47_0003785 [Adiantum capillus-veneris]